MILTNLSQRVIEIETRKVIAQVLFLRKEEAKFVEVDKLDKTDRGVKVLVLLLNKKNVSKITKVCHQFMQNCVQYNLTLHERKYVSLIHLLNCDDFVIFLSHDKKYFGGKIEIFI